MVADLPLSEFEENGFNLVGVLAAERYDALVAPAWRIAELLPGARSALLVGCGGPELFRAVRRSPEWHAEPRLDPVDRFARRLVEGARDAWIAAGYASECFFYFDRRDDAYADFVGLAIACGLGVPSRLRILLHPRYGPWWSIRALLLTERALEPTSPRPDWNPCDGCPAPCATHCVADDVVKPTGFDLRACLETREKTAACRVSCAARRACVVGPDQAYDTTAEAYHIASAQRAINEPTRRRRR